MNGYDETIPWPKNMPRALRKSAKRLDIYNRKKELEIFLALEQEKMEMLVKTAEIERKITPDDADIILTKLGL